MFMPLNVENVDYPKRTEIKTIINLHYLNYIK